jgi:hypothetical protein
MLEEIDNDTDPGLQNVVGPPAAMVTEGVGQTTVKEASMVVWVNIAFVIIGAKNSGYVIKYGCDGIDVGTPDSLLLQE